MILQMILVQFFLYVLCSCMLSAVLDFFVFELKIGRSDLIPSSLGELTILAFKNLKLKFFLFKF